MDADNETEIGRMRVRISTFTVPRVVAISLVVNIACYVALQHAVAARTTPCRFGGERRGCTSHLDTTSRRSATAKLYTFSGGQWRPATSVKSLAYLRGVLTVHGSGLSRRSVTVTMTLSHLSWQGYSKVVMPPSVHLTMTRTAASSNGATFMADVQIPTLLPVYWSVVKFVVSDGQSRTAAQSGVMVLGPAKRTTFNTLTVSQAHAFCSARPRLRFLRYAVYLNGYFEGLPTPGDGPPIGIVLDRPRPVPSDIIRTRTSAHGIVVGGFGIPRDGGWATVPGFLECTNGKAGGFGADA